MHDLVVKWTEGSGCKSRVHCVTCRSDSDWQKSVANCDFDCPHGITQQTAIDVQKAALIKIPDYEKTHPPGAPRISGCCDPVPGIGYGGE